jgi:L-fuconolactonase
MRNLYSLPVDKGAYGYAAFWNACKVLTRAAGAAEKADLFSRTAARFYGLELGS